MQKARRILKNNNNKQKGLNPKSSHLFLSLVPESSIQSFVKAIAIYASVCKKGTE